MFPDPDKFDIHRQFDPQDSLGYGYGAHRCIAEHLAKAELEIVFGECPSTVAVMPPLPSIL